MLNEELDIGAGDSYYTVSDSMKDNWLTWSFRKLNWTKEVGGWEKGSAMSAAALCREICKVSDKERWNFRVLLSFTCIN